MWLGGSPPRSSPEGLPHVPASRKGNTALAPDRAAQQFCEADRRGEPLGRSFDGGPAIHHDQVVLAVHVVGEILEAATEVHTAHRDPGT